MKTINKIKNFLIKKWFVLLFFIVYLCVIYEYYILDKQPENMTVIVVIVGFMYLFKKSK